MTDTLKRNEVRALELHDKCRDDIESPYCVILEALNTKDRERDEAVAEAFKAGQKSLLKNLRRLTPQNYGKRFSYIMVDEMGEVDWEKIATLTTPQGLQDNKQGHGI